MALSQVAERQMREAGASGLGRLLPVVEIASERIDDRADDQRAGGDDAYLWASVMSKTSRMGMVKGPTSNSPAWWGSLGDCVDPT